jgi:hypothetical protein
LREVERKGEALDRFVDSRVSCGGGVVSFMNDAKPDVRVFRDVHETIPVEKTIVREGPSLVMVVEVLGEAEVLKDLMNVEIIILPGE